MTTLVPLFLGGTGVDATGSAVTFDNGVIVDDINLDGKVVTMTGSTDDTAVFTVGTNGTLSIVTTDTAAAAANIQITADGTFEVDATTITLDSAGDIVLDAAGNNVTFKSAGTAIGDFVNSSSDFVIESKVQDKDIIFKGDDNGSAITALTLDMSEAGAALFNTFLKSPSFFWSNTDNGQVLRFGTSAEIQVFHVHDVGLTFKNTVADTDNRPFVLQLKSEEDAIVADDVIASIELAAGDSGGTDAATVSAGIHAIAEGEFTASANPTTLKFTTGVSESAAASATAKMTLSSAGLLTIADDFMIKDGGTIGVASAATAITIASTGIVTLVDDLILKDAATIGVTSSTSAISIASTGIVTFVDDILIKDGGTIGSASDADSITIAADGVVTMNQIPVFSAGINVSGGTIAGTLATAAQTNITSLGTLTTLTVDDITINGSTISDAGDFALDISGDIILDANGADIIFKDDGTEIGRFTNSSTDLVMQVTTQDKDIIFKGDDGGSAITALTLDMSDAGAATFNAGVTATSFAGSGAGLTAGTTPLTTLDIDGGTEIGEAIVDADLFIIDNGAGGTNRKTLASRLKTYISAGSTVALDDITTGDAASTLATSAGNITIDAQGDNTDIILKGTDGGADTTFLTIDGSAAGKATFNNEVVSGAVITSGAGLIIADAGNIGSASDTDSIAIASDGVVTMNQIPVFSAGINVSGGTIAGTIATAAQTNITSLGTLTALTVDDVAVNGKVITMTGSTNDTAVFTAGTNGTLSIVTTDTAAAAANIEITADGTAELAGTTVTLNSSTTIEINADNATTFFKDGSTAIAAVAGTPQAPGVTQNAGFVPVGSILAHGSATVPTGWLDATAGAAVSRTTFSVLFAVLSTLYGAGNGTTTFNLPSLGDRMIMGKGTNNGTIGASSTGASGSFVVATASGSAALTKTTTTFATSAKDSSTATGLTNVTAGGHTHNVTMPSQICMYIIKA